jgi:hypothetical protein
MAVVTNWKGSEENRSLRHLIYIPRIFWMCRLKKEYNFKGSMCPISFKIEHLENTNQKYNGLSQL